MHARCSDPTDRASDRPAAGRAYAAIALFSCAVLLYEVLVTRVMSTLLWYHFAFLSISLAMLGLGAPGVWYALRPIRAHSLRNALLLSGLLVPLSLVLMFQLGDRFEDPLPLYVLSLVAPMLALGSAVCILLVEARGKAIGRMYGADLLGATAAALVVVPLMHVVPTPLLVVGAGLLPLLAAALLRRRLPVVELGLAGLLVGLMVWGAPLQLRFESKQEFVRTVEPAYERWTPTARLTIYPTIPWRKSGDAYAFGWGMGAAFQPQHLEQLWLELDGSAGTPVTRLDRAPAEFPHLLYDVTSAGYQVRHPERVCIIGAGGGRDILTALAAGARDVDAVELNEHIIGALSGPFREYSGDVYHLPGVNAVASEGRAFLTRSRGGYDLVQISLIDSWAATAAGAYALSENYLYTVEAFRLYWNRLSADGLISTSRWAAGRSPLESARLAVLAAQALAEEGVAEPKRHLAFVKAGLVGTLLVSTLPWEGERLAALDAVARERGFERHWPRHAATPAESAVARALEEGPGAFSGKGYDISPPVDDHPFFFQTLFHTHHGDPPARALQLLMGLVSVMTLVLFFLPFLFTRRMKRERGFWPGSAFFGAIGLAFMFVEVPWIQRYVLYLGHPSHATTVVLATMLLGAGAGAFAAARVDLARIGRWGFLLPLLLVGVGAALGEIFRATLGLSFPLRALVTLLLTAPAGFLMGFAFPAGMMAFGGRNRAWFWAVNGAASVLGSVFSLALSMSLGFSRVMALAIGLYAVAWLLLWRARATDGAAS